MPATCNQKHVNTNFSRDELTVPAEESLIILIYVIHPYRVHGEYVQVTHGRSDPQAPGGRQD